MVATASTEHSYWVALAFEWKPGFSQHAAAEAIGYQSWVNGCVAMEMYSVGRWFTRYSGAIVVSSAAGPARQYCCSVSARISRKNLAVTED